MSKNKSDRNAPRLLILEGDGIGPEIVAATLEVLKAADAATGIGFEYDSVLVGWAAHKKTGTTFPDSVVDAAKSADGLIMGPVSHNEYPPADKGGPNPSGRLRKNLDLFANIRPAKSYPGFAPRCGKELDLVIVRENTEGFYSDRNMFMGVGEFMPTEDIALSVRKVSRKGSTRIAETAFQLAMKRRKKLTIVHKANVLRMSDGFFLDCVREVGKKYPEVEQDEKLVDAMAALLVRDAGMFDVILTTNMFGDILSDQATEISGSIGLAASTNVGETYGMAQAQHGSAPDIAGKNIANPSSLIGSTAMLLSWMSERRNDPRLQKAADLMQNALEKTIAVPEMRTGDMGGRLGTREFAAKVAANIGA